MIDRSILNNTNKKLIKENLNRYLELETLLNDFFNIFNFCMNQCIALEIDNNNGQPVSACCKDRYYCIFDLDDPSYDLLRIERENRYDKPEDQINPNPVSPCEYHGPQGCRLATHKSPICLAFMCRKSIYFLRDTYSIYTYDYLGMYYALEWILTGIFSEEQYIEFKESINTMIHHINECHAKEN